MGTDGLWDVTSNERVAETVQRSLEQFPAEDAARYRYRFTSAAQDLVMSSRGKLNERSWRTADGKSATIDDISVFVIPLAAYKEEYLRWKLEMESQNQRQDNLAASNISTATESVDTSTDINIYPGRVTEPQANGTTEALLDQEPSFTTVSVEEDKNAEENLAIATSANSIVGTVVEPVVKKENDEADPDNESTS